MKTERFTVPADHPCLPGHFPQRPVVPAVVILEAVIAAAGRRYGERVIALTRCKFLRPLAPETACEIALDDDGDNRIRFRCTSGGAPLAEGRLELEAIRNE